MVIRRISPWSCAKVAGVLQAAMGVIVGLLFSVIGFVAGSLGGAMHETSFSGPAMGLMFGAGAIVILPIVYGILGLVAGALSAFIYNMAAAVIGGIEIDVEPAPTHNLR